MEQISRNNKDRLFCFIFGREENKRWTLELYNAVNEFLIEHQSEVKNMCLTEYNEAETMQMFKEEGREEGREEGSKERLIRQVCRKLRKGKEYEEIAEDLEEDEMEVKDICEIAKDYGPYYDEDSVIDAILRVELV